MSQAEFRRQVLLVLMVLLAMSSWSCTSGSAVPTTPSASMADHASRIVLAPLNIALPMPEELRPAIGLVADTLSNYLIDQGKSVEQLDPSRGHSTWTESIREVSQSSDEKNFINAARAFTQKLGKSSEFDLLILPSLYIQNARIREDGYARWDGAKQKIEFVGRTRWEVEDPALTTVQATSILLHIFDRNGNSIHTKKTGLELVQHMEIHVSSRKGRDKRIWILVDDKPPLDDRARIKAAIAHALYPVIPKTK